MPNQLRWGGSHRGAVVRSRSDHPPARIICTSIAWLALGLGTVGGRQSLAQPGDLLGNPQLRTEAVRAIPFDQLSEAARARLLPVVSRPTIYRRMPSQVIGCDPDLHVFLVRYPEVVVNIWQLMEITQVQLKRTGPFTFDADDGAGTVSKVELIYGRPDLHIYYAEGYYEGPLFRNRMRGDCVLILRSAYATRDERAYVTNTLDIFVRTEHPGADLLLKTLHPLMGRTADYNFVETTRFIGQVSQASENNGPGMDRLAGRLTNVGSDVRDAFSKYTEAVYQRAVLRHNAQAIPPLTPGAAAAEVRAVWDAAAEETVGADSPREESEAAVPRPSSLHR